MTHTPKNFQDRRLRCQKCKRYWDTEKLRILHSFLCSQYDPEYYPTKQSPARAFIAELVLNQTLKRSAPKG